MKLDYDCSCCSTKLIIIIKNYVTELPSKFTIDWILRYQDLSITS